MKVFPWHLQVVLVYYFFKASSLCCAVFWHTSSVVFGVLWRASPMRSSLFFGGRFLMWILGVFWLLRCGCSTVCVQDFSGGVFLVCIYHTLFSWFLIVQQVWPFF